MSLRAKQTASGRSASSDASQVDEDVSLEGTFAFTTAYRLSQGYWKAHDRDILNLELAIASTCLMFFL